MLRKFVNILEILDSLYSSADFPFFFILHLINKRYRLQCCPNTVCVNAIMTKEVWMHQQKRWVYSVVNCVIKWEYYLHDLLRNYSWGNVVLRFLRSCRSLSTRQHANVARQFGGIELNNWQICNYDISGWKLSDLIRIIILLISFYI